MLLASYGRNKNRDYEIKEDSTTSPEVQFKEISINKEKIDRERTLSELGKPFPNHSKSDQKTKKNKINVKMTHVNKKNSKKYFIKTKKNSSKLLLFTKSIHVNFLKYLRPNYEKKYVL